MTCQACEEQFRFEFCDLATGRVRAVHVPLAVDWGVTLTGFGKGSLTLPTKAVPVRDIWPHLTSIYILRTAGGTATPAEPVVEFAGMIEKMSATDSGTTQLGLQELPDYLNHRMITDTLTYGSETNTMQQTEIAKKLVEYAQPDGIPLFAVAAPSSQFRTRTYESWNRSMVGEMIENLAGVIDGVEWELEHAKSNTGEWSTTMIFRDSGQVGADRGLILRSDVEALGYGLDVDAVNHATHVDGIGSGEEVDMLVATSVDPSGTYPRFDAAPAWKDVTVPSTLQEHADGYREDSQEPVALPSVTLYGLDDVPPEMLQLGDTVFVDVNYGAVTYVGPGRVTGIAWSLSDDEPVTRTVDIQPTTRASQSVLNQIATDDCPEC